MWVHSFQTYVRNTKRKHILQSHEFAIPGYLLWWIAWCHHFIRPYLEWLLNTQSYFWVPRSFPLLWHGRVSALRLLYLFCKVSSVSPRCSHVSMLAASVISSSSFPSCFASSSKLNEVLLGSDRLYRASSLSPPAESHFCFQCIILVQLHLSASILLMLFVVASPYIMHSLPHLNLWGCQLLLWILVSPAGQWYQLL